MSWFSRFTDAFKKTRGKHPTERDSGDVSVASSDPEEGGESASSDPEEGGESGAGRRESVRHDSPIDEERR